LQGGAVAAVLVIVLPAPSSSKFVKRRENTGYQAISASARGAGDYHFSPSGNHHEYSIDN
jgi:hypothetical protein